MVLYCTLQVCELMVTVIIAQAPRGLNLSEARDLTSGVAKGPIPLREGHESNKDAILCFEVHHFPERPLDHPRGSAPTSDCLGLYSYRTDPAHSCFLYLGNVQRSFT